MSLPPGFLDELRSRISLGDVAGKKLMWDTRKSNMAKGDLWAPCPFHQEKTASFHVDDRKGYYYCFGCHAKGDAISFVRETENVEFMEAVRILAADAGMQIPERDPQAQQKADRRTELIEVMEMAVQFFRLHLKTAQGAAARAYLDGRHLSDAARDRFDIGFAPDGWQNLWEHLRAKGVAEEKIVACGLAKESQKGGKPYDTFRNRIMFPIRDPRGRAIAFGGRAMDPNDTAKYLNSPETELFDKSRTLYNHGPAREAAGKGQPLIVAEGYMDVIALSEAGFGAAVAPLGTAVTEHHLALLWRVAPEPLIALDGDKAGLRAAYRVIEIALPLLEAGKSLRFVLMPEGQDPDDLIRAKGAAGVAAQLAQALPMVNLLWQRETEGQVFDSPERRAALDATLREKIKLIRDPSLRHHYGEAIKELRYQLFSPKRAAPSGGGRRQWQPAGKWRGGPVPPATPSAKHSYLAQGGDSALRPMREAVILAALISCPEVAEEFDHVLERMESRDPTHARLAELILTHAGAGAEALTAEIHAALGPEALERLMKLPHVALTPPVRHPGNVEFARMTVAEELAKLASESGLASEIREATESLDGPLDETVTWRLSQAAQHRNEAIRALSEDKVEYIRAENGAEISRAEKDAFADLLSRISQGKPQE